MSFNSSHARVPFKAGEQAVSATFEMSGAIGGVPVASPAVTTCGAQVKVIYARIHAVGQPPTIVSNLRLLLEVYLDKPANKDGHVTVNVYLYGSMGFTFEQSAPIPLPSPTT